MMPRLALVFLPPLLLGSAAVVPPDIVTPLPYRLLSPAVNEWSAEQDNGEQC